MPFGNVFKKIDFIDLVPKQVHWYKLHRILL